MLFSCHLQTFFKLTIVTNFSRKPSKSKSLDPNQPDIFVWCELGLNCLRLIFVATSMKKSLSNNKNSGSETEKPDLLLELPTQLMVTPCNLPSYWALFTSNLTSLILIRARWTLHRTRAPCRTVVTHGTIILRWRSCALSCWAVKSFSTLPGDSVTRAVVARGACVAVFQGDVSFDCRERAGWAGLW